MVKGDKPLEGQDADQLVLDHRVRRRREGRMGYYRLWGGAASDALAASLEQLRQLSALRPEASAEDADDR